MAAFTAEFRALTIIKLTLRAFHYLFRALKGLGKLNWDVKTAGRKPEIMDILLCVNYEHLKYILVGLGRWNPPPSFSIWIFSMLGTRGMSSTWKFSKIVRYARLRWAWRSWQMPRVWHNNANNNHLLSQSGFCCQVSRLIRYAGTDNSCRFEYRRWRDSPLCLRLEVFKGSSRSENLSRASRSNDQHRSGNGPRCTLRIDHK